MPWIPLTADHVKSRLSLDEIECIEETGGGDGDRLAGILTQVTALVRGKASACRTTIMGASGTIPEESIHAAATIALNDLRATLPTTGTDDEGSIRKDQYRDAVSFLSALSKCEVDVNDAATAAATPSVCFGGDPKLVF